MQGILGLLLGLTLATVADAADKANKEANAYYEKHITWLWLSHAACPILGGGPQARNLINKQPERAWGRVAVARYPNRRTFLQLLSDPADAPMEPYKFIAMDLDLVPVSGDMVIPD